MSPNIRVSVITVTRNSEAVLPQAMASLARQTFRGFEWIVIDGASQDSTVELAKRFRGAPVQIVSEADTGIYDAMNKGVKLARGEYLYFLNSDDRFAGPDVLARTIETIDSARSPDLLIGRVRAVGRHHTVLRDYSHIRASNLLFHSLCHQATFARLDLFTRFGAFDLQYKIAADFDWFARVLRGGASTAFTSLVVANFSKEGTHVRLHHITRAETLRIQRAHTGRAERAWCGSMAWIGHKGRRVMGLQARGCLDRVERLSPPLPEDA